MSRSVVVTAASVTSSVGPTLDDLWSAMMAGETFVRDITRFPTAKLRFQKAACAEWLGDDDLLVDALMARCLDALPSVDANSSLFVGTAKGRVEDLMTAVRANEASPSSEGDVAPWAAERLGIIGPRQIVSAACASSNIAIGRAAAAITRGDTDSAVVLGVDIVSQLVFTGFASLMALSGEPCRPFASARDGLSLGDAAGAIVLREESAARSDGETVLGVVEGWASANDAVHITAPARDGCGLTQAIGAALARANRASEEIAAINAHGTGTVYNDAMECVAFRRVFGERVPPFHSVKGTIGHTLGAAGVVEVCVALRSLSEGVIPPTTNLTTPDETARGRVSNEPQSIGDGPILSVNSGFGGVNAALVLRRG